MTELRALLLVLAFAFAFAFALVACSVDFHVGARPTGVPDASAAVDGGSDADLSEAGVHSCNAVVADFCADFETGDVASGWDHQITVGGKVELDPNHGRDSARSARFQVPSGAGSATLVKKLAGPWRPTTVEFDTFVASPSSDNVALMAVVLRSDAADTSASTESFAVNVSPTAVTLIVQTPDEYRRASTKSFPYDRWVHVVFTVDWDTKSAAVALDGQSFVAYDGFPSSIQLGKNFETQVQLGAAVVPQAVPVSINHDNIVVRRR